MSPIKVGGQCEGYGGLFAALQQHLDVEHAWYAETDEAASKVLAHHYRDVPNLGDITAVDWAAVECPDIMTSGFPCQGFSMAGKRGGSSDERHLWPTGVLPAVAAMMPPLVVLENVPGLLTIEQGQIFARVLADLDDLGYTTSWAVIGACRVGACHHRHRVFVAATLTETRRPMSDPVAHRDGDGWGAAQTVLFGDAEAVRWPASGFTSGGTVWELPVVTCGEDLTLLPTPRTSDTNGPGVHGDGGMDLRTVVSMFPTPTAWDATRGAGWGDQPGRPLSEVIALLPTPTVADSRGSRNATAGRSEVKPTTNATSWTLSDVVHAGRIQSPDVPLLPTPKASDAVKGGPNQRGSSGDLMLPSAVQPERFGVYAPAVARHERAYGLVAPDPTEPGRLGKPRLSGEFPAFMQGLPPGWLTDVVGRNDAVRLAGNGVNPRQCAYALSTLPTFRAAVTALTSPVGVAA